VNPSEVVFWIVEVLCVMRAVMFARLLGRRAAGWIAKLVAIAAVALALRLGGEEQTAAMFGLGAYVLLVALPLRLSVIGSASASRSDYAKAVMWLTAAAVLHPFDGARAWLALYRALARFEEGAGVGDLAALAGRERRLPEVVRHTARSLELMLSHRFEEHLAWCATLPAELLSDQGLTAHRYRSLCETGRLAVLAGELAAVAARRHDLRTSGSFTLGRALLFSFAGRVGETEALLGGGLRKMLGPEASELLLVTALYASGDPSGSERLAALCHSPKTRVSASAKWRLTQDLAAVAARQAPELDAALSTLATQARADLRVVARSSRGRKRAWATWTLATSLVVVFVLEELLGGSMNEDVLIRMGALWAPAVAAGEWWRLVAPGFLHFGALHLALNTWGLLVLGPAYESLTGWWQLLLAALGSSVLAMATIVGLAEAGVMPPQLVVGASAAVMGLVGALATAQLKLARGEPHSTLPRRIARRLLLVVVLQTGLDLVIAGVSLTGHLAGAAFGLLLGALLPLRRYSGRASL
jgi:rhomboid protease GluP